MKKNSRFVYQIIVTCGLLMFSFMIVLMVWGEHYLPDERTYTDFRSEDYSEGWFRITENGDHEPIILPGHYNVTRSNELIVEKEISYITEPLQYLSFDSEKQDIYAYVDGNSSYVQQLCWLVWARTDAQANEEIVTDAKQDLLLQNHA